MKSKIKGYWIIIAFIIVLNIIIFMFFSKHLESYVVNRMIDEQMKSNH